MEGYLWRLVGRLSRAGGVKQESDDSGSGMMLDLKYRFSEIGLPE